MVQYTEVEVVMVVKERQDVVDNFLNAVLGVLEQHRVVLHTKRKQKQYLDDYGVLIDNGWEKEKEHFVINVLLENERVLNCIKEMQEVGVYFYSREHGFWINNIFIATDHVITKYISLSEAIEIVKDVSFAFSKVDWKSDNRWMFVDRLREAKEDCCHRGIEPPIFDCLIDAFLNTQGLKPNAVEENTPLGYEYKIANKLQQLGFTAQVTKASGDQGADIIAEKNGKSFAIQCKLYSKPVGNQAVQEAYAATTFYRKNRGVVVSNADFTKSARQLANTCDVILLNDYQLDHLLDYV